MTAHRSRPWLLVIVILLVAGVGCERRVTAVQWGGARSETGHATGETAEQLWGGYGAGIKGGRREQPQESRRSRQRRPDLETVDITDPAAMQALKRRAERKEPSPPKEPAPPSEP